MFLKQWFCIQTYRPFLGGILLENKGGFYALTISAVLFIPLVLYILKNRFYQVEEY